MIKTNRTRILLAVVFLEAALIMALIICRYKGVHFVIRAGPAYSSTISSPLELALEYQSPDKKFEELVKRGPSWMKYRAALPEGAKDMPILASCAVLNLTNHVRICIANGADTEEAIGSLKHVGQDDAIKLIQQIKSELRNQSEGGQTITNSLISTDKFPSR